MNTFTEKEKRRIARCILPLVLDGSTKKKMAEEVEKLGLDYFSTSKNPYKKFLQMYNSKSFQELLNSELRKETETESEETVLVSGKVDTEETVVSEIEVTAEKLKDITPDGDFKNLTEADILKLLGYDPSAFVLQSSSCKRSSWNGLSRDEGGMIELSSFRLSGSVRPVRPENGEVTIQEVTEALKKVITKKEKPIVYKRTESKKVENKIAIVNVADLHLGKLAWAPECGESYDHKIATKRFRRIVSESIAKLKKEDGINKIVFFWSQDFFHFDSLNQLTTAGTFQNTDVRWQKMFTLGVELLIEAVDSLKQIADVYTFYTRSNHDEQVGFYAATVLGVKYENDSQVTVDNSPSPRKYIRYGVNLLGFAHGDKEGKRLPGLMSREAAMDWGKTWNREFFLGHFHSQRVYEDSGVICRHLSAPCGPDAWHSQLGFTGAQKASQLFIRGEKSGPIAEYTISLDNANN